MESIEDDTYSEPSGFDDSDFIQQQEITQILKSNSKCLLEHQLWLNTTKLNKWQMIEKQKMTQNEEERNITKWKLGIYGKFVSELERRIRKLGLTKPVENNLPSLF